MLSRRNALIVVLVVIATGLGVWIASAALTQVTVVFTIDETDPASLTDPVGDDCPVGAPCKVKSDLNVADVDQPVSSVTSISPTAFTGVVGTLIPNGDVVGKTDVIVHWTFLGSCSSSSPTIEGTNDFLDGGIKGQVDDDPDPDALDDTDFWPTLLEKDLRVEYLLTTTGHTLLRRSVAVLDFDLPFPYPNIQVPVNLLSFDVSDGDGFGGLTLQGTYNVAVVGDPTSPPGGTMCTPMTSDSLLLGKTAAGLTLLTCEASGTHTMTTVLTREVGGVLVLDTDPPVSDTVNCSLAVGGIAEYPDIAESVDKSSPLPPGALAGAAAAGVVVLVGGAWYARRRWLS